MSDRPLRHTVIVRLHEATQQLRDAEEQHEQLIKNAAAEGHAISAIAPKAGLSEPTIRQMVGPRPADAGPTDAPRRRVILLGLPQATNRLRLAKERHEKLIENAAAERHAVSEIALAAGLSPSMINQTLRARVREAGAIDREA